MHSDGERHLDVGGARGAGDEDGISGIPRLCQRLGQVADEEAGRQNDKVGFGQERGFERLARVEQEDCPRVGDACRATCQPEFEGGIRFADGGKFGRKILRADVIHEDLCCLTLAEEVG